MLPFGRLLYGEPNAISNAVSYAKFYSRAQGAVIRVYDATGTVIETHESRGRFQRVVDGPRRNIMGEVRLSGEVLAWESAWAWS